MAHAVETTWNGDLPGNAGRLVLFSILAVVLLSGAASIDPEYGLFGASRGNDTLKTLLLLGGAGSAFMAVGGIYAVASSWGKRDTQYRVWRDETGTAWFELSSSSRIRRIRLTDITRVEEEYNPRGTQKLEVYTAHDMIQVYGDGVVRILAELRHLCPNLNWVRRRSATEGGAGGS